MEGFTGKMEGEGQAEKGEGVGGGVQRGRVGEKEGCQGDWEIVLCAVRGNLKRKNPFQLIQKYFPILCLSQGIFI